MTRAQSTEERVAADYLAQGYSSTNPNDSRMCTGNVAANGRACYYTTMTPTGCHMLKGPFVQRVNVLSCEITVYLVRNQGSVTAQRYMDDVLRPVTFWSRLPKFLYRQDSVRIYIDAVIKNTISK
ncbi:hypothetical protein TNCV_222801 [Trichonephila clavipes]|nr:hypothetical protein TNCV_222801 [Trichonephila clavipes]